MTLVSVPIFTQLNNKNGTLYNFSEYNNDITKSIANSAKFKREPSKFVCIKLPKWQNKAGQKLYLDPSKIDTSPLVTNPNILMPKLLQNYVENFAAYAKLEEIKDVNVEEWAFWKLMETLGAVKMSWSARSKSIVDAYSSTSIVKYIGYINVVNYVEYGNRTYTELYMHIPSDAKPLLSVNWSYNANTTAGNNLARLPMLSNGANIALGLKESSTELTNAVYDFNTLGDSMQYYDMSLKSQKAALNFNSATSSEDLVDFDFNAILIYYDTYDIDSNNQEQNRVTKLGGIFFINDFEQNAAEGYWEIPSVTKYNAGSNNTLTGNAIAYRLCTNFFTTNEQSTIDTIVNEYNTVSMDLYVHALQEMLKTSEYFKTEQSTLEQVAAKLSVLNYGDDLYAKINTAETKLDELSDIVNTIIGADGYTVTNFQLLDAFAKLSNDFKGLNGQNVNNTFVFNQTATSSGGASIKFNDPYTYIANNKYSIGYADESMLQVGLMRNRILTKYNVVHAVDDDNNLLVMTLIANDDNLTYAVDGAIYSNAQSNQNVLVSLASNANQAKPYVLLINKTTGILECQAYDAVKASALKNYAFVGHFILPTKSVYLTNGLYVSINSAVAVSTKTDIHVLLKDENGQGSYKTGDTVAAGSDMTSVLKQMLIDDSLLYYEQPSFDMIIDSFVTFYNTTNIFDVHFKFNQHDAGELTNATLTSNAFKFTMHVDIAATTVTFGNKTYAFAALPRQLQPVIQISYNSNINAYTINSKYLTILSSTNTTDVQYLDDDTIEHALKINGSGEIIVTANLNVVHNYADLHLMIPLEFSSAIDSNFMFFAVYYNYEFDAGIVKYDFDNNEVLGKITSGNISNQIIKYPDMPVLLYQIDDAVNNNITDLGLYPYKQIVDFNTNIELNCWLDDAQYIVFATPTNDVNKYTINSLFINDAFACNLKFIQPTMTNIVIHGYDYDLLVFDLGAGFIEATTIVANITKTLK